MLSTSNQLFGNFVWLCWSAFYQKSEIVGERSTFSHQRNDSSIHECPLFVRLSEVTTLGKKSAPIKEPRLSKGTAECWIFGLEKSLNGCWLLKNLFQLHIQNYGILFYWKSTTTAPCCTTWMPRKPLFWTCSKSMWKKGKAVSAHLKNYLCSRYVCILLTVIYWI